MGNAPNYLSLTLRTKADPGVASQGDSMTYDVSLDLHRTGADQMSHLGQNWQVTLSLAALQRYNPAVNPDEYSKELSRQVFPPNAKLKNWDIAQAQDRAGHPIHVRVILPSEPGPHHQITWELLMEPGVQSGEGAFLGRGRALARYINYDPGFPATPSAPRLRKAPQQLRALICIANPPQGYDRALPVAELEALCTQLERLQASGGPAITCMPIGLGQGKATYAAMDTLLAQLRAIPRDEPYLLILVAHGGRHPNADRASRDQLGLQLYTQANKSYHYDWVSFDELLSKAVNPAPGRPLLVMLLVCHSGSDKAGDPFASLAPRFIDAGSTAVVGMHELVQVDTALSFTREFLTRALTSGNVDEAVTSARQTLRAERARDWWRPALFLRTFSGLLWGTPEAQDDLQLTDTVKEYVNDVREAGQQIPLVAPGFEHKPLLARVYCPLRTAPQGPASHPPASLLEAIGDGSCHIYGGPGSGKTTFVHWLSGLLADASPHADRDRRVFEQTSGAVTSCKVPAVLDYESLYQWYRHLKDDERPSSPELVWQYLEEQPHRRPGVGEDLRQLWAEGHLWLFLDGAPPAESEDHLEDRLADSLSQTLATCPHGNRLIVTSRGERIGLPLGLRLLKLADLNQDEQEPIAKGWLGYLQSQGKNPNRLNAEKLLQRIKASALQDLASNPLMLTLLAIVYASSKHVPAHSNEAAIYEELIRLALSQQAAQADSGAPGLNMSQLRDLLMLAAWQLRQPDALRQGNLGEFLGTYLEAQLGQKVNEKVRSAARRSFEREAARFLHEEHGTYSFCQTTIREYLDARAMLSPHLRLDDEERQERDPVPARDLFSRLVRRQRTAPLCTDTLRLLAEQLVNQGRARDLANLVEEGLLLARETPNTPLWLSTAGQLMLAWQPPILGQRHEQSDFPALSEQLHARYKHCRSQVIAQLVEAIQGNRLHSGELLQLRFRMADTFGTLDDPPPGVVGFPLEWCWPKGQEAGWAIVRYPITVGQLAQFVEDGGYTNPEWWRQGVSREAATPGSAITADDLNNPHTHRRRPLIYDRFRDDHIESPITNLPVNLITYYEALAFCTWLSKKIRDEGWIEDWQDEDTIRLPTVGEWQAAAWRNEAQTVAAKRYLQLMQAETSSQVRIRNDLPPAVGLAPHLASTAQVDDIGILLREWCNPEPDTPSGQAPVCGSSFLYQGEPQHQEELTCINESDDVGFRVVWARAAPRGQRGG